MNEFVARYHTMLADRDAEEEREFHKTKQTGRVLKTTYPFEAQAAKFYTRGTFNVFSEELKQSGMFFVLEKEAGKKYFVRHWNADVLERWRRVQFEVTFDGERNMYTCECGMCEHMGFLCRHGIRVLIHLGKTEIPEGHLLKRWSTRAIEVEAPHLVDCSNDGGLMMSKTFRQNMLYLSALDLVKLGDGTIESFKVAMKCICNAKEAIEQFQAESSQVREYAPVDNNVYGGVQQPKEVDASNVEGNEEIDAPSHVENDVEMQEVQESELLPPEKRRSRGRPSNARLKHPSEPGQTRRTIKLCSTCHRTGHNSATCHVEGGMDDTSTVPAVGDVDEIKKHIKVCSKCHQEGHMKTTCGRESTYKKQKKSTWDNGRHHALSRCIN